MPPMNNRLPIPPSSAPLPTYDELTRKVSEQRRIIDELNVSYDELQTKFALMYDANMELRSQIRSLEDQRRNP